MYESEADSAIIGGGLGGVPVALSAFCSDRDRIPRQVRTAPTPLTDFQRLLADTFGVELARPDEVRTIRR